MQLVPEHLTDRPSKEEIRKAINQMQSGKASGEDRIPLEIYKHGGKAIVSHVFSLFGHIQADEDIPEELNNAIIITLHKQKGSKGDCGNYQGISLLSRCSNILAKILQRRLVENILDEHVSESQYGFRSIEQNVRLYAVFVDLTKAFDSASREAL